MQRWLHQVVVCSIACMLGCGPEIPFNWQVVDVLDLGMSVEVETLGPLGNPPDPLGRSLHEAMPLDEVRASVMVADVTGPVPEDELSFAWFVCSGGCSEDAPTEPCPDEGLSLAGACSLGTHPSARFSFADVTDPARLEEAIFGFRSPFIVRAIGGRLGAPGPAACIDRLERGDDLGDCLIVDEFYRLGSTGELVELIESRGVMVPTDLIPETERQFPRNRVPKVETLLLTREDGSLQQLAPPTSIEASVGETLEFTWVPADADIEAIEIESGDGIVLNYSDDPTVAWWTTQRASVFDYNPLLPDLQWVVGPDVGAFTLFVRATDARGARSWTWVEVEVTR